MAKDERVALLRMIGVMSIGVGIAWLAQVFSCGDCTGLDLAAWVMGAAAFAGAGSGLILVCHGMTAEDGDVFETGVAA